MKGTLYPRLLSNKKAYFALIKQLVVQVAIWHKIDYESPSPWNGIDVDLTWTPIKVLGDKNAPYGFGLPKLHKFEMAADSAYSDGLVSQGFIQGGGERGDIPPP